MRRLSYRAVLGFLVGAVGVCLSVWPGQAQQLPRSDLSRLLTMPGGEFGMATSADPKGSGTDFITVNAGPGAVRTFAEIPGPAIITRVWVTIDYKGLPRPDGRVDAHNYLRKIQLKVYWDGETNPSIDTPLGDFFCVPFAVVATPDFSTACVGVSSKGMWSYFPMPFRTSARFEIVNDCYAEIRKFFFQICYQKVPAVPPDTLYFHAKWHRDISCREGVPYVIIQAEGKGQYIGANLNLQGLSPKNLLYLEGNEAYFIDGEQRTALGTGVEDYFNSAWFFKGGAYFSPYAGCTMKDDENNRIGAYRFHILDPIPFNRSIKITLEHGTGNHEAADFAGVAYWYQTEPHKEFFPTPPLDQRVPRATATPPSEDAKPPTTAAPRPPAPAPPPAPPLPEQQAQPWRLVIPAVVGMAGIALVLLVLRRAMRPGA